MTCNELPRRKQRGINSPQLLLRHAASGWVLDPRYAIKVFRKAGLLEACSPQRLGLSLARTNSEVRPAPL